MNAGNDSRIRPESWFDTHRLDLMAVGIPLFAYFLVTLPLRHWIVDDAGITFAYARSLADGHGLVAQPGLPPVEGYSNPLWLLMMTPFFLFKFFNPYIVPKLVALVLTAFTFVNIHRALSVFAAGRLVSVLSLTCLALNASFVVWSCSGLENSLLAALTSYLFLHSLQYAQQPQKWSALTAGLIAVGIALTRPDGIAYVAVYPLIVVMAAWMGHRIATRRSLTDLAVYSTTVVVLYAGFLLFRLAYFGKSLPNTAYAKGRPNLASVVDAMTLQGANLDKWRELSGSLFGNHLWALLPLAVLSALIVTLIHSRKRAPYLVLLVMLGVSWLVYLLLPTDWMGEFRFATPFFMFFYAGMGLLGYKLLELWTAGNGVRKLAGVCAAVVMLGATGLVHTPRLLDFYRGPVVAFDRVAHEYAFRFNRYAESLDLNEASVMLPDIGATLYYSDLRVYDMVGLTDTLVAYALGRDKRLFHDYVFETARPTFIHTHGNWTYASDLDSDDRFRRDYVAINEYPDQWVKNVTGRDMMSGNYVRRDAVAGKEHLLTELK